ncbi:hypothetical protein AKJ47_01200 [candidate division MSBL1 archaeon SCGC-AAA261G05]|uniref:Peptidase A2 domain-containing protein n=3 Tax=candidate division MSBL1 TaxID=215777 RepID=A0A133V0A6_9EURY|nr:hypothetical protein AKJ42_02285 [candidate division MSBL1 archaeon SCGC-AAA261C02]KXB04004.1 hypothetical protein AKJ47_01200 [candidate division MSBL1 archaeon SCGC-AAA261G05]KXB04859.1 hypothetical protein AKJ48_01195 [candidate division MSBL1 archaeon SCGC-AAA261O19]
MGHTEAKVKIYESDPSKAEELELLVDTGSTYSWIPAETLEELRVERKKTRRFETIEGKKITRDVGEIILECLGESATNMVVFAKDGDKPVLGVVTLELLGLEVDPTTNKLRKAEALLAI